VHPIHADQQNVTNSRPIIYALSLQQRKRTHCRYKNAETSNSPSTHHAFLLRVEELYQSGELGSVTIS
jgi:hypothetical protein